MVREAYADPEIVEYLNNNFIPVRLEGRHHLNLAQKWDIRGIPRTLVRSPDEREIKRLGGLQPAASYLRALQSVAC